MILQDFSRKVKVPVFPKLHNYRPGIKAMLSYRFKQKTEKNEMFMYS